MNVEPAYASSIQLRPPRLEPRLPMATEIVALADLIIRNRRKVWFGIGVALALIIGAVGFLFASVFGWLVFTHTGGYVLIGMCALFAAPRLCLVLLVLGGIVAVAFLDQAISSISAAFVHWWPLVVAFLLAIPIALLVEAMFFRR